MLHRAIEQQSVDLSGFSNMRRREPKSPKLQQLLLERQRGFDARFYSKSKYMKNTGLENLKDSAIRVLCNIALIAQIFNFDFTVPIIERGR